MVRGKGLVAEPGTREFQKEAYIKSQSVPLSQSEIMELNDEKKELETVVQQASEAGPGSSRAGSIDIMKTKARIAKIDETIEMRTPETVRGKSKDSLIREENEIEDRLSVGMPTRYEMDHPARCPGAVRKHLAWLSRNNKLIERYVEIQKIIRPEEPKSVEDLRKDGGPQDRGR